MLYVWCMCGLNCVIIYLKMPANLTLEQRSTIVALHNSGFNISQIIEETGFAVSKRDPMKSLFSNLLF